MHVHTQKIRLKIMRIFETLLCSQSCVKYIISESYSNDFSLQIYKNAKN